MNQLTLPIPSKPCRTTHCFDGATYDAKQDQKRLSSQHDVVFDLMADGKWRTLEMIEIETGHPITSISARLRDMRKAHFGAHTVNRRRVEGWNGLHEYKLIVNEGEA